MVLGEARDQVETKRLDLLKDYKISEEDFIFLQTIEKKADTGTAIAEDWEKVYRILEIVQRVREKI